MTQLLNSTQAALLAGVRSDTISSWHQRGELKAASRKIRPTGGVSLLYRRADVLKIMARRQANFTALATPSLILVDVVYLAGLWDGEGCFSAFVDPHDRLHYKAALSMTDIKLVKSMHKLCQLGRCYVRHSAKMKREGKRPQAQWHCSGREAVALARLLLPYLRSKYKQAELLIAIGASKEANGGRRRDRRVKERERRLALQISRLNTAKGQYTRGTQKENAQ
jgi:hypothetical protein